MNQAQRRAFDRLAPFLLTCIAAIAIWALVSTYANGRADSARQDASIKENTANAITSCQNANESRDASRTLWFFVVDLASRGAPPPEVEYLAKVRLWIGQVYQNHDCNDLARKYVLPPPPSPPDAS